MTALLIDFATLRPVVPAAWCPKARGKLSLDTRADLRDRWLRRQMSPQAANHECQALDLRCMLEPVDSPACNRLHSALKIAAEARALAWKKRQRDHSPEAERAMIEDETWLEAVNGRKRRALRARQ